MPLWLEGPEPPHTGLSLNSLIAKGEIYWSIFEKFWAYKCNQYIFSRIFSFCIQRECGKTWGLFLVTSCSLWPSPLHSLFVHSATWEQSRKLSPCCQFCWGRLLNQMRAWSSCLGPCSLTGSSLCFTWASCGQQAQNMQLHGNCIILLPDHNMPVQPLIKTREFPVLHALHS